ncbi:hypothetical protein [Algoriphagus faecimaris]|uniref:hypothetical protein n=1 Tax=Algoriphagus faecimaris TaxID=686796 RepID=UPI000B4455D5|nr:hypothetical protein [Algoriphagus faecimaris]
MKKVLFGVAFLGAMAFSGITAQGQGSVDPGEGNRYGGVCCLNLTETCPHPVYGWIFRSDHASHFGQTVPL